MEPINIPSQWLLHSQCVVDVASSQSGMQPVRHALQRSKLCRVSIETQPAT